MTANTKMIHKADKLAADDQDYTVLISSILNTVKQQLPEVQLTEIREN